LLLEVLSKLENGCRHAIYVYVNIMGWYNS